MMNTKQIRIALDTDDKLDSCVKEYRKHHSELNKMHISKDKIIDEIAEFYLRN